MEIKSIKCPECGASSPDDINVISADNIIIGRCSHCKSKFIINDFKKEMPKEEEKPAIEEEHKEETKESLDFNDLSKNVRDIYYLLITYASNYQKNFGETLEEKKEYLEKLTRKFNNRVINIIPPLSEAEKIEFLSAVTRLSQNNEKEYYNKEMINKTIDKLNKSLVPEEKNEIEFQDNRCSSIKTTEIKKRIMSFALSMSIAMSAYFTVKLSTKVEPEVEKTRIEIVDNSDLRDSEIMAIKEQIASQVSNQVLNGEISDQEALSQLEQVGINVDPNYLDELHLISDSMGSADKQQTDLIIQIDDYCERNNVPETTRAFLKSEDCLSYLSQFNDEKQRNETIAVMCYGLESGTTFNGQEDVVVVEEPEDQKPMSRGL